MKIENIKITKDQAESLKDLIDIWFFREVRENKDDDFIEELLEIHFKVKTKAGKNKMLSWFNFKNPEDTFVELFGDDKENPKRKLSFSMKCDGYDTCITNVKGE